MPVLTTQPTLPLSHRFNAPTPLLSLFFSMCYLSFLWLAFASHRVGILTLRSLSLRVSWCWGLICWMSFDLLAFFAAEFFGEWFWSSMNSWDGGSCLACLKAFDRLGSRRWWSGNPVGFFKSRDGPPELAVEAEAVGQEPWRDRELGIGLFGDALRRTGLFVTLSCRWVEIFLLVLESYL